MIKVLLPLPSIAPDSIPLISILENPASIVVTTPIGLIQHIEPPDAIRKQLSYLKVGDAIDLEFLIEWLVGIRL